MAEECGDQAGNKQAGLWACHEVLDHRKPLMWFKGGLCSLNEFEPLMVVTASILGIEILALGRKAEGEGHGGGGGKAGAGREGACCFCKEVCQEKLKGPFVSLG